MAPKSYQSLEDGATTTAAGVSPKPWSTKSKIGCLAFGLAACFAVRATGASTMLGVVVPAKELRLGGGRTKLWLGGTACTGDSGPDDSKCQVDEWCSNRNNWGITCGAYLSADCRCTAKHDAGDNCGSNHQCSTGICMNMRDGHYFCQTPDEAETTCDSNGYARNYDGKYVIGGPDEYTCCSESSDYQSRHCMGVIGY